MGNPSRTTDAITYSLNFKRFYKKQTPLHKTINFLIAKKINSFKFSNSLNLYLNYIITFLKTKNN